LESKIVDIPTIQNYTTKKKGQEYHISKNILSGYH